MKNHLPVILLVLLKIVFISFSVHAQETCAEFGTDGIATSLESHKTHLNAVTVLPNGKIVAVGYYDDNSDTDFLVAKYNASGSPDLTFSPNGIKLYDVSDHKDDEALCVSLASDGNILVGGIADGYGSIIKINTNGALVSGFGADGIITYDVLYSSVEEILVSPGGNIYGLGKTFHTDNIVIRNLKIQAYTSNGESLTTFAENGKYNNLNFQIWHESTIKGVLQSDEKIVVAGTTFGANASLDKWTMLRLNTNGTIDTDFGTDGLVEDPENTTTRVKDIKIGTDGSIYLGGYTDVDSDNPSQAVVKKFKPDGASDNSFNMIGSAYHLLAGGKSLIHAITINPEGNVFFAGSKADDLDIKDFLIASFKPDGEHDSDFGVHTDRLPLTEGGELTDMVRLDDGSFIVCGYAIGQDRQYGILRKYKADGSIEPTFNSSGASFIRYASDGDAQSTAVQSDGKILVAGSFLQNGSNTGLALARFESNGNADYTFGNYGYVRLDLTDRREFVKDLYLYPDGKFLLAGTLNHPTSFDDYLIAKFNTDGTLDQSFGNGGYVNKHVGAYGKHNDLSQIAVDAEGRILIAGEANYLGGSYGDATLMRLLPDGSTDDSFGDNGVAHVTLTVVNDMFTDVAIATDGSIFASGHGTVNVGAVVMKFKATGEVDLDFGTDGQVFIDWDEESTTYSTDILIQPDGKLLVGCIYRNKEDIWDGHAFVKRLLADGQTDISFGDQGVAKPSLTGVNDQSLDGMLLGDDGVIYVSGIYKNPTSTFYFSQIKSDGTEHAESFTTKNFVTEANISINETTGNVYSGIKPKQAGGLAVVCLGKGSEEPGEEPDPCLDVPDPYIFDLEDKLKVTDGDSFQWYADGEIMDGETDQILFDPQNNVAYSVEVTTGECVKVTDDYLYELLGVESEPRNSILVFPNPARSILYIKSSQLLRNTSLELYTVQGDLKKSFKHFEGFEAQFSLSGLANGFYVVKIQSSAGSQILKIFKQP